MAVTHDLVGTAVVYHAIGVAPPGADSDDLFVSPAAFEGQLEYLSRHRKVVPLSALLEDGVRSGKPAVAITFDDGFRSLLTVAAPLLERYGFPATAFVTTRWLDGADESPAANEAELLTEDDVRELAGRGFEIGSHGHTHADLGRLSSSIVEADLVASLDRLEGLVGARPRFLAWPYGSSSAESERVAQAVGFEAAFAFNTPSSGPYALSRVPVYRLDGRALFRLKTSGRYIALRRSPVIASTYSALDPVISRGRERLPRRRHASGRAR